MARHVGELDDISHTIWGIIRHWLPASGEKMRKAPILFHYTNLAEGMTEARHVGELDDISHTIWGIIRHWLPASGEKMRKAPILFHYTNLAEGMTERRLETDIFVPLA